MYTTREQHRAAKAIRIAGVTIRLAKAMASLLPTAFSRKRPRVCKRMPARAHGYRRAQADKQAYARARVAISPYAACIQIATILSQPIPKFKNGAIVNNGKEETNGHGQAHYNVQQ